MSNDNRPVFIVGAARSGTTLIQSLITGIPGFFSCPETHFFNGLMAHRTLCGGYQLHRPKLKSLPETISERHLLGSFPRAAAGFLRIPEQTRGELLELARANLLSPKRYLTMLMTSCSPTYTEHSTRWVEKTPIHASYLEEIFELFPDAQVVSVQREPTGVLRSAVSLLNVPVCIVALDYYRAYRDVKRYLTRHPVRAGQVFMVSYDKVLRSDEAVAELLEFVGARGVRVDAVRQSAKGWFRALYGDDPLMKAMQPKMGDNPEPKKAIAGWKAKAIEGYAALLMRMALDQAGAQEHMQQRPSLHLVPMLVDLIFGVLYVAKWRARWLVSVLGNIVLFRSVSC